jgi:hypothetical protein
VVGIGVVAGGVVGTTGSACAGVTAKIALVNRHRTLGVKNFWGFMGDRMIFI